MSSFEQFSGVVSSSEAGVDFERENIGMKHLTRMKMSCRPLDFHVGNFRW